MATISPFDEATVDAISRIVGDTSSGFSGTEIARLLRDCQIPDPGEMTKWRRIAAALREEQIRSRSGNCAIVFLKTAMKPVRWTNNRSGFQTMKEALNTVLAFSGLSIRDDGLIYKRKAARTHDEAAVAKRLRDEMVRRAGHSEVFKYCTKELVAEDCFGAVFEASKGLCQRVREMCSIDEDGHRLVQEAFEGPNPMIAMNSLQTETEKNEQRGLASIMKGVVSAFRNPEAHEPKRIWHVSEADALDLLSTVSLIHRRLDLAVVIRTGA